MRNGNAEFMQKKNETEAHSHIDRERFINVGVLLLAEKCCTQAFKEIIYATNNQKKVILLKFTLNVSENELNEYVFMQFLVHANPPAYKVVWKHNVSSFS